MNAFSPDLLVVGHVTCDVLAGQMRLGGAASFAARAAAASGISTALVTAAPPGARWLAELRRPGLAVHCRPSPAMTTFALEYRAGRRWLRRLARAEILQPEDVPIPWRRAPVVYLAPVADECAPALVEALEPGFLGAGLQGWLRAVRSDGTVEARDEIASLPRVLRAAILSDEDHPEATALAERLAREGVIVALTRGPEGATIFHAAQRTSIPAVPAQEVDPTGAGDVFGVVFTLALARGRSARDAAEEAAAAAARVVEGPGLGRLEAGDVSWALSPSGPIPAEVKGSDVTVPVQSSLERSLLHESLRQHTAQSTSPRGPERDPSDDDREER